MVLDSERRLAFERERLFFRMALLIGPVLLYLEYGSSVFALALSISVAILGTSALIWLACKRLPEKIIQYQLHIRIVEIALIFSGLFYLDRLIGTPEYDLIYILPVTAATATHGRRGLLITGGAASLAVIAKRILLASVGTIQLDFAQMGDALFYCLIFFAAGGFVSLVIAQRDGAEAKLQKQSEQSKALVQTASVINSTLNLQEVLQAICTTTARVLNVPAVTISLVDPQHDELRLKASYGLPDELVQALGPISRKTLEEFSKTFGTTAIVPDIQELKDLPNAEIYQKMNLRTTVGTRMMHEGALLGRLNIATIGEVRDFGADELEMLEGLADQAAIAISNATLFEGIKQAYDATLEGWVKALDLRDRATKGHTLRVTGMTIRLARAMGVSEPDLVNIRRGALLHDIGKIGIPDSILGKKESLTPEEWEMMHKHPEFARTMLESIEYLRPAIEIPYGHHERWDGSGYPRGLRGEEISLAARIFAVVDVWDALLSDRPYRKRWAQAEVLKHLQQESGRQFDPKVVESFLHIVLKEPAAT
ncbi:HD domain-containing protein [Candidatus Acetothermia bacterium]|nr:HD domain-containing protein [Candidatus Acetothermia bacterium]MBI3644324.1 HD domain-containing protein [Candidatus Acetothermia bacterium]